MLTSLKNAFSLKGYRLLSRPYELNVIGVRTNSTIPNAFDDLLCACFVDSAGKWQLYCWAATTDPGTYWLQNPMSPQGTAILKPGQYENAYAIGMHRGQYKALVQVKPVTVLRDFDRNGTLDYSGARQQTGLFGINIHRAQQAGTTRTVDKYSAGCQVFASAADFNYFMQLCEQHKVRYGNAFTYTLLLGFTAPQIAAALQQYPSPALSRAA